MMGDLFLNRRILNFFQMNFYLLKVWIEELSARDKLTQNSRTSDPKKPNFSVEDFIEQYREAGVIETKTFTYMRGRTLSNALVIIDEAQEMTSHHFLSFIYNYQCIRKGSASHISKCLGFDNASFPILFYKILNREIRFFGITGPGVSC